MIMHVLFLFFTSMLFGSNDWQWATTPLPVLKSQPELHEYLQLQKKLLKIKETGHPISQEELQTLQLTEQKFGLLSKDLPVKVKQNRSEAYSLIFKRGVYGFMCGLCVGGLFGAYAASSDKRPTSNVYQPMLIGGFGFGLAFGVGSALFTAHSLHENKDLIQYKRQILHKKKSPNDVSIGNSLAHENKSFIERKTWILYKNKSLLDHDIGIGNSSVNERL